jgi:hypothetical protein
VLFCVAVSCGLRAVNCMMKQDTRNIGQQNKSAAALYVCDHSYFSSLYYEVCLFTKARFCLSMWSGQQSKEMLLDYAAVS